MRLLLACLVLFLAPAGALIVAERSISGLESEFFRDARSQVDRLNSLYQLYPPRVRRMPMAPAILQLRGLSDGASVANVVCGAPDSPFRRLFDRLSTRCESWSHLRRARWLALLAAAFSVVVFGLVLTARITVQRYASRELWPGTWTMWFVMRGVTLLLALQVAASLSGYGVVLEAATGKVWMTLALLIAPFLLLLFVERKLVLRFVEPEQLRVFRARGVTRAEDRAPAAAAATEPVAPAMPRLEPRPGIGVARRRRGAGER